MLKTPPDSTEWLTLRDASVQLGISPATLRYWADQGKVQTLRTPGGHRRFNRAEMRSMASAPSPSHSPRQVEMLVHSIVGRARLEIAGGRLKGEPWYRTFDSTAKEQHRELGHRLMFLWSPIVFMSWYLFGAALNAGWIGHGTLSLLVRRRWANVLTVLLILGSVVAAVLMLATPLNASQFTTTLPLSEQYRNIMPQGALVRLTTPFFNIYGLITLVGGALYSAFLFWKKRILPNRVMGNVLIAIGALSIGFASTLTRLGLGGYLYLGELIAAVFMYAGFVMASQPSAVEQSGSAPQPA